MAFTSNLRLSSKFTLILSALLIGLFLITAYLTYRSQQDTVQGIALIEAQKRSEELIQIFNHISEVVGSEPEHNYALVPQVMTTQLARKISADGHYSIRQVSLDYRNPANRPDTYETEGLARFSAGETDEIYRVATISGKKVFRYLKALKADQSCLKCHGSFASAPPYIQQRFPENHPSYNYQVGDIMGAVSFIKSMDSLYAEVAASLKQELVYRAVMLLLFVLMTFMAIRRLILARLQSASATIHTITSTGSLHERIPTTDSRDEIGQLLLDFNAMMAELERTSLQREESEIRYRSLIEATRSAIVTFLDNGRIVISNQKAEQLFGLSRQELLGERLFDYLENGMTLEQKVAYLIQNKTASHLDAGSYRIKGARGYSKKVEIVLVLASETADQPMLTAILRDPAGIELK